MLNTHQSIVTTNGTFVTRLLLAKDKLPIHPSPKGRKRKGVKYRFGYSGRFRDRPRGRIVDSSPSRLTVSFVHCGLPKGTPGLILLVNASCSFVVMA